MNEEKKLTSRRTQVAAWVYGCAALVVVAFQFAMAAGAPWGEYAMGGAMPGVWPTAWRVAALVQAALHVWFAAIVFARAGVIAQWWTGGAARLIWVVVAVAGIATVLNVITPSAAERLRWAPIAIVLLVSSLIVARSPKRPPEAAERDRTSAVA